MTHTSKCNNNNYDDDDGIRHFTLLWLVEDRSAPTDVFSYHLKLKCLCVVRNFVFL